VSTDTFRIEPVVDDRGLRFLTDETLVRTPQTVLQEAFRALEAEAIARGLIVRWSREDMMRGYVIEWRPLGEQWDS